MRKTLLTLLALVLALPGWAQERRPSHCIAIADAAPGLEYLQKASWSEPIEDEFTVRLSYIDHSMYLIQTAGGLSAVTDYVGYIGAVLAYADRPDGFLKACGADGHFGKTQVVCEPAISHDGRG